MRPANLEMSDLSHIYFVIEAVRARLCPNRSPPSPELRRIVARIVELAVKTGHCSSRLAAPPRFSQWHRVPRLAGRAGHKESTTEQWLSGRQINSCHRRGLMLFLQLAFPAYLCQFRIELCSHQHGKARPVQPDHQRNGSAERPIGLLKVPKWRK